MTATLTTVNGIMKEVYEGDINNQLPEERVTLKRIERTSEGVVNTVGGKYVVFPVRHTRNHGISYRAENGALADAGRQGYSATQETLKYGYGRVAITGQTMALAEKNFQSFASALDREMDGLKSDISRDENRIAIGHASSTTATGIIAALTATATSATQTVDSTDGLEVGMVVDVVNAGTPVTGGTGAVITAIASSTSVTFNGSVTGVSGNFIVRTGNWDNEPNGLLKIVDSTGSLHNIDGASAEYWRSTEDSSTTTLTELSMITNCDVVYRKGGSKTTAIFASLGVRRAYFNLMTSLRRYNEPKEFSGGLIGLAFNYGKEIPVVADMDIPTKTMIGLDENEMTIYRDKEWYWEDTDGSVFKWVHGYDRFEALLKCYWQFVTHKRNAHWKMTNITES
jgi:hypothetical protein